MKPHQQSLSIPVETEAQALTAPWTMRFTYTRTYGPVVGRFIAGLSEKRILGQRADDGAVFVPPTGYDPRNSKPLGEWVEVTSIGTITAVAWVDKPADHHPFERPFGWAQIRLDGANSDLTHFVVSTQKALAVGDRVTAHWASEPNGTIKDLAYFEPLETYEDRHADDRDIEKNQTTRAASDDTGEPPAPVEGAEVPVEVDYQIYAGFAMSRFLRGLQRGELIGARAPDSDVVYVPPVGVRPLTLKATTEPVTVSATATLITYIIVHIPVRDKSIPLPYACGDILLDGADTPFLGLIQDVDTAYVRCGMRLRAVLRPESERELDTSAISHFIPIDEPDVDVEALVAKRRAKAHRVYDRSTGDRVKGEHTVGATVQAEAHKQDGSSSGGSGHA